MQIVLMQRQGSTKTPAFSSVGKLALLNQHEIGLLLSEYENSCVIVNRKTAYNSLVWSWKLFNLVNWNEYDQSWVQNWVLVVDVVTKLKNRNYVQVERCDQARRWELWSASTSHPYRWSNLGVVTKFKVGVYDQVGRCGQQRKLGLVIKSGLVTNDKLGVIAKTGQNWESRR